MVKNSSRKRRRQEIEWKQHQKLLKHHPSSIHDAVSHQRSLPSAPVVIQHRNVGTTKRPSNLASPNSSSRSAPPLSTISSKNMDMESVSPPLPLPGLSSSLWSSMETIQFVYPKHQADSQLSNSQRYYLFGKALEQGRTLSSTPSLASDTSGLDPSSIDDHAATAGKREATEGELAQESIDDILKRARMDRSTIEEEEEIEAKHPKKLNLVHKNGADEDAGESNFSQTEELRDGPGSRPRANSTDIELKLPQQGLCDERSVWQYAAWNFLEGSHENSRSFARTPKGLQNLGNTCFLNSTLQCLAYLPPFCQYLIHMPPHPPPQPTLTPLIVNSNGKRTSHRQQEALNGVNSKKLSQGLRFTLMLRKLFCQVHGLSPCSNGGAKSPVISPGGLVQAVPSLGSCGSRKGYKFRPGRQEDAHEFLVHLLDAMNDGELRQAGIQQHVSGWRDRLPIRRLDETTFVHRVFGGYFRSQVQCTSCGYCSNTYDPFLDLSLEVSRPSCRSLVDALKEFTRKERLDSANRWKCSGCKRRVCATKQLTVFRPPLVLCIQLKRFAYNGLNHESFGYGHYIGFGGGGGGKKIAKPIEFSSHFRLPLSDGRFCEYSLTSIIVHVGGSASSGHYTAFIKRPEKNGREQWFHMDDSYVEPVTEGTVLKHKDAYILFYCRREIQSLSARTPNNGTCARAVAKSVGSLSSSRSEESLEGKSPRPATETTNPTELSNQLADYEAMVPKASTKNEQPENTPVLAESIRRSQSSCHRTHSPVEKVSVEPQSKNHSSISIRRPESSSEPTKVPFCHPRGALSKADDNLSANDTDAEELMTGGNTSLNEFSGGKFFAGEQEQRSEDDSLSPKLEKESAEQSNSSPVSEGVGRGFVRERSNSDQVLKIQHPSEQKKAVKKKVILDRGEGRGRVEVIMGPRSKNRVWKPVTNVSSAEKQGYDLLGNVAVGIWEDDETNQVVASDSKHGNVEHDRSNLVLALNKKANKRKRRMYLDSWDSALDQGKKKKVKKKIEQTPGDDSSANQFLRIQISLQQMQRRRPKGMLDRRKTPGAKWRK